MIPLQAACVKMHKVVSEVSVQFTRHCMRQHAGGHVKTREVCTVFLIPVLWLLIKASQQKRLALHHTESRVLTFQELNDKLIKLISYIWR